MQDFTYAHGLVDGVSTGTLATGEDGEWKIEGGYPSVGVEIEQANNDKLPANRVLDETGLLLKAREELIILKNATGVIPKHGQPQPLILGQAGLEISIRAAHVGLFGNKNWSKVVERWKEFQRPEDWRPRLDGLVCILRVEDGTYDLGSSGGRRWFMLGAEDSGIDLWEEGGPRAGGVAHGRRRVCGCEGEGEGEGCEDVERKPRWSRCTCLRKAEPEAKPVLTGNVLRM